jgi:hypothetical protein
MGLRRRADRGVVGVEEADSMNRPDIDAAEKRAAAAWGHVTRIMSGEERWRFQIPANPEKCSDVVIGGALLDIPDLIAYIRHLESGMRDIVRSMAREKRLAEYKADEVRG